MSIRKTSEIVADKMQRIRELQLKAAEKQAELKKEKELNEGVPYQVRKGDNLTKLSKATDISIHDLAKDNNIKDVNKINEGDTIFFVHHHKPEDAINSESMNEDFPNMADQGYYLDKVEEDALEKYHRIANEGAQQYLDDEHK